MSAAKPASTTSTVVQGLVGCGGLLFAGFALLAVVAVVMPSDPDSAPTTTPKAAPTIVASIQDFQTGIPLLEQTGLDRQQDPGGIEYRWSSGASWIKFYDYSSDAKLDRISAVLATPQSDQGAQILAAGLSLRLIQLASGREVSVDELNSWLASVANGDANKGEVRTFDGTPMRLQGTLTADGGTGIHLTIGDL